MYRNGQEATTKVEVQLIELRRRIEAQKSQAGLSQASSSDNASALLMRSNESARSGSIDNDQSNHSKMSRNSSLRDGKEGEQAIRRTSLRLPPLESRGLSPSKSSRHLIDRMYDVIMLDQMMPIMVTLLTALMILIYLDISMLIYPC